MLRNFMKLKFEKTIPSIIINHYRLFHEEFSSAKPLKPPNNEQKQQENLSGAVRTKYKIFKDEESKIIYDVEEEKQRLQQQQQEQYQEDYIDELEKYVSLERGIHGVFEIEELVDILKKENAIDIFVCSVPKEIKYVDYMCIVTGRSYRHMLAIVEYVRKIYKLKRNRNDIIPKIEGEKSRDWMAIDLGNIALHIFSEKTRQIYDLETLWSIGPEYDAEFNKPKDPLIELFEKNSIYLHDLKPKEIH